MRKFLVHKQLSTSWLVMGPDSSYSVLQLCPRVSEYSAFSWLMGEQKAHDIYTSGPIQVQGTWKCNPWEDSYFSMMSLYCGQRSTNLWQKVNPLCFMHSGSFSHRTLNHNLACLKVSLHSVLKLHKSLFCVDFFSSGAGRNDKYKNIL